jgi:hypothetical protein
MRDAMTHRPSRFFSRALPTFLAAAALVPALPVSADSGPARITQPIVNGHPADSDEQWGTIGILTKQDGGDYVSSGTLIAPSVIVTAAHCLEEPTDTKNRIESLVVIAGANNIDAAGSDQIYVATHVLPHPDAFKPDEKDNTGLGAEHDIALLLTDRPVTGVSVMPILPEDMLDDVLTDGTTFTIAGYGRRSVDGDGKSDPTEDGLHYVGSTKLVKRSDSEFLAGGKDQGDSCPGDSGGPAYVKVGDKLYLAGLVSRGRADFDVDCGEGGIYTLIPAFLEWIEAAENADDDLGAGSWTPDAYDYHYNDGGSGGDGDGDGTSSCAPASTKSQGHHQYCSVDFAARPARAPLALLTLLATGLAIGRRRTHSRSRTAK